MPDEPRAERPPTRRGLLSVIRRLRDAHPLRWIGSRIKVRLYRFYHPDEPLLAPEAVRFLERGLNGRRRGLEWGAGRSTLWFAERLTELTSVEHHPKWHDWVVRRLREQGLDGARCLLRETEAERPSEAPYVRVVDEFADGSLDFCLVDGRLRAACARAAVPKMGAGGMIVLDDAQRYVHRRPDGALAVQADADEAELWRGFLDGVRTWECRWHESPLRHTAIWTRPD